MGLHGQGCSIQTRLDLLRCPILPWMVSGQLGAAATGALTLKSRIHNPLLFSTSTIHGEIPWYWMVYLDEASLLIDNGELMFVRQSVVSRTEFQDCPIALIEKRGMPMSVTIGSIVVTFKGEQDVLAFVTTSLKVRRPNREVRIA